MIASQAKPFQKKQQESTRVRCRRTLVSLTAVARILRRVARARSFKCETVKTTRTKWLFFSLCAILALSRRYMGRATWHRSVGIVIVTHDALRASEQGLLALKERTDWRRAKLTIVDSGSNGDNLAWFISYCERSFCTLFSRGDIGYTKAVNFGVRQTYAKYVVIMNPDVVIFDKWLDRLKVCMDSCSTHGIVGPLSNAASFQNVPYVYDASGNHHTNPLSLVSEQLNMNHLVRESSTHHYPRATFINGFLFMIRRELFDALQGFDESLFPIGYGEENDFAIRAQNNGYSLAIDDTSYAYHFKTTSFTTQQRVSLSKLGSEANKKRHGQQYKILLEYMKSQVGFLSTRNVVLNRLGLSYVPDRKLLDKCIVFVLPVRGSGGGVISIIQEVEQMRAWNVSASIAVWHRDLQHYVSHFSENSEIFQPFVTVDHLTQFLMHTDILVGTHYSSIRILHAIKHRHPTLKMAYYVQDYEPYFFAIDDPMRAEAVDSYTVIDDITLYSKTDWIAREVQLQHSRHVMRVRASLDHTMFRPRSCPNFSGRLTISAMVRPATPRRGAERTLRVLAELKKQFGSKIIVETFGCELHEVTDLHFRGFYRHHGILDRKSVANLFRRSDIFIDLSDYQAFGRSLVECMASGCIPVGPTRGAASEAFEHGINGILVDVDNESAVIKDVSKLVAMSDDLRQNMILKAVSKAAEYSVEGAAEDQLRIFHAALGQP